MKQLSPEIIEKMGTVILHISYLSTIFLDYFE